jgi:hypothetical protein
MFIFDVEAVAEESFLIAWDFLDRTGSIDDVDQAMTELGDEIITLLGRGESHKIRIANLAIDAYRRRHAAVARLVHDPEKTKAKKKGPFPGPF